jgi:hypothetical protein
MARLPNPGSDNGTWGDILNDYLLQAHKSDGTLEDNAVTASTIAPDAVNASAIQDGSITETLLDGNVQTKLNASGDWNTLANKPAVIAAGADQATARSVIGAGTASTKSDVGLGNVDNTSDATKNSAAVTLTNKTLTAPKFADLGYIADANGNEMLIFNTITSAVNNVEISNSATGLGPEIYPTGDDTNISLNILPKGTGSIFLRDGNNNRVFEAWSPGAGGVNFVYVQNNTTGNAPILASTGSDTNIDLNLVTKGSGLVKANSVEVATISGTQTLTNKTLDNSNIITVRDDRFTLQDSGDTTKQVVFQLSGLTTGVTRTITVPDSDITLGAGGGDASTNTATSVDSEVALFSGTGGKTLKRATGSGIAKLTSGVLSTGTAGIDYTSPTSTETMTNKTLTAPVISATTTSAGTAAKLTSGTVMTTAEAGALEYDGTVFYQTTNASNRGLSPAVMMCRLHSAYTLTSTTSVQQLFNSSTNGRLTLPVGTYRLDCLFSLSSMSATSGNGAFSLAGTATLANVLMYAQGRDGSINTVATLDGTMSNAAAFPNPMHTGQAATSLQTHIMGSFEVTVAGTIIPSFALNTAAAAIVAAGSYFECWSVGATTATTIGEWD